YGMAAKSITSSVLMRWIPGTRFIYEPLQIAFDRARPMVTGYFLGLWTTMAADNGVIWSRINAYDAQRESLEDLLSLDPIATEDTALFKYEDYLRQRLSIDFQIDDYYDRIKFNSAFLAILPATMAFARYG